jgi:hypothetical protein
MDHRSEIYVTLFAALANELGKTRRKRVALRLAAGLANRHVAEAAALGDVDALAARLAADAASLRDTDAAPRARTSGSKRKPNTAIPARRSPVSDIDAAKQAIRQKFDAWRAVKKGERWHAGFARKMVAQHKCIEHPRLVEAWARAWEVERQTAPPPER